MQQLCSILLFAFQNKIFMQQFLITFFFLLYRNAIMRELLYFFFVGLMDLLLMESENFFRFHFRTQFECDESFFVMDLVGWWFLELIGFQ